MSYLVSVTPALLLAAAILAIAAGIGKGAVITGASVAGEIGTYYIVDSIKGADPPPYTMPYCQ